MDSLVTAIQSVWCTAEQGEWTTESKGDSAEELQSVKQGKQICEVMYSRLVLGPWAQSTEHTSAELSLESDSWNYCECSVFITNGFNCFINSVNKRCYLLSSGSISYNTK